LDGESDSYIIQKECSITYNPDHCKECGDYPIMTPPEPAAPQDATYSNCWNKTAEGVLKVVKLGECRWGGGDCPKSQSYEFLKCTYWAKYSRPTSREDKDGDGYSTCDGDCNDSDRAIYPGAKEICDGKDNDCNGAIDDLSPTIEMVLLKQCSSLWGTDIYDKTGLPICKKGCALTAVAMMLKHYGITLGADGKEATPKNLNEWLINNYGYDGRGGVNWDAITEYTGGKIAFEKIKGRNDEALNNELNNGNPVILNVPGHFVIAIGRKCLNGEETWIINDPGRNRTTLKGYGNDYRGLRIMRLR
jgi:hypothetical protein